jgi:amidophosphoribosyltransferase
MARDAGAKKVYFASCAPAIRFPNVYGIDMPTRQELVAFNRTNKEIAEEIGADEVIFQVSNFNKDLDDLIKSVQQFNSAIETFDVSVFTGCYVTGDIDDEYIQLLERQKSASVQKLKQPTSEAVIGLHNNYRSQK